MNLNWLWITSLCLNVFDNAFSIADADSMFGPTKMLRRFQRSEASASGEAC